MYSLEQLETAARNAEARGDAAAAMRIRQKYGLGSQIQEQPQANVASEEVGGFIPGVVSGGALALRSFARPVEDIFDVDTGAGALAERAAEAYPTQFRSVESFKEAPWTSIKEIVGQQLPFLAEIGAGAAAGGRIAGPRGALVGAFAPSFLTQYEEARQAQEEAGTDSPMRAILPAAAGGALDVLAGPERMLAKTIFGEAAREAGLKGMAKAAGKGAAISPFVEAPTEVAQEGLTQFAADQPILSPEAIERYKTAALGGAVGGTVLGGALGAAQAPKPPKKQQQPEAEEEAPDYDPEDILAAAGQPAPVQQATPQAQEAQQEAPLTPLEILDAQIADAMARGDQETADTLMAQRPATETGIQTGTGEDITLESPPEPEAEPVSAAGIKVGKAPKGSEKLFEPPVPEAAEPQAEQITLETKPPAAPEGYITGRATPQGRAPFVTRNDALAYRREIKGEQEYDVVEKDDGIVLAPRPKGEVLAQFPTKFAALNFRNRRYPEAQVRQNAQGTWDTFIPPPTEMPPVKTPPARALTAAESAPPMEVTERQIPKKEITIPPVKEPAPEPASVEPPTISTKPVEETPGSRQITPEAISAPQERIEQKGGEQQYPQASQGELSAEAGGGNRAPEGGQVTQEEVAPVAKESLWKYNKRSGVWDHVRGVVPETRDQWLSTFQKDEPEESFVISAKKPTKKPDTTKTPVSVEKPVSDIAGEWRHATLPQATVQVEKTDKGYAVTWAPEDVQEFRGKTAQAKVTKALQKEGYQKPGIMQSREGKPLSKIKVKRVAVEEGTGRRLKVSERADEALADVDKQISAVEDLIRCLGT